MAADERATPSASLRATPQAPRPTPGTPKQRPDPRPMRLVLGAGTIAAVSIMAAGLVRFPSASADASVADAMSVDTIATAQPEIIVKHKIRYVQLKPGQRAPQGAKVIAGAVPTPRVVVTRIAARPATTRRTPTQRVVTRTKQSGH